MGPIDKKRAERLEKYRAQASAVFTANIKEILGDSRFDDSEKAGTLVMLATSVLSHAAFLVGTVDPRLKNAPPEAQMDDMLSLMREILVTSKPISKRGLQVVDGGKDGTP